MRNPLLQSKCSQVANFEMCLCATGSARPVKRDGTYPLWKFQEGFKSPLRIVRYQVTMDKKWLWFCKWYELEFRYDLRDDWAKVFMSQDALMVIMTLMPEGLVDVLDISKSDLINQLIKQLCNINHARLNKVWEQNPSLMERLSLKYPELKVRFKNGNNKKLDNKAI